MPGVTDIPSFNIHNGDGVTLVFVHTLFAYQASQIKVFTVEGTNDPVDVTGSVTVTLNSSFIGGNVTFAVAPTSAQKVLIQRLVPFSQETEFADLTRYKETAIEIALNTLCLQNQQLRDSLNGAVKYLLTAGVTNARIGAPADGKALIFSGVSGLLVAGPDAADIAGAQTYAQDAETAKDEAVAARDAAVAAATGMKWRPSVRFATVANDSLSGLAARDGVTPVAGNRALVRSQSAPAQNGVYITSSGAWTRATDADTWDELVSQVVAVEEGSTQADKIYICTSNSGGTLGTTAVTWFDITNVLASQAEAEAGVENTKTMTALRTRQAIAAYPRPTRQILTSGTTYTTPANCRRIEVYMVGAGGGGGGYTGSAGSNGGNTSFNSVVANGGIGGGLGFTAQTAPGAPGSGGTGTATARYVGSPGRGGSRYLGGGGGDTVFFGGGGHPGDTNGAGATAGQMGGGGAGAGTATNDNTGGKGGGPGESVLLIINNPAASYTYSIGTAGAAGTSPATTGGPGYIEVIEYY